MADRADSLCLVGNAVSSDRTVEHAGSIVVVPVQLAFWKMTQVFHRSSLLSVLYARNLEVCRFVPLFCVCSMVCLIAPKTYG